MKPVITITIGILLLSVSSCFAAVEDIGIWTDSAGSQIPGTTFGKFQFANEVRNDNSLYTIDGGNDDITLGEDGNFLVLYYLRANEDDNGRINWNGRVALNGTAVEGSYCSGYARNNNNDELYCRGAALILNASGTDSIAIEYRRDADSMTNGSVAGSSEVMIVRITNDADAAYGHYSGPTAGAYGGTTWGDLDWGTIERETNTDTIERQAGNTDIRLKPGDTNFLIIYSGYGTTGGSRTQRITRAVSGSTEIPGSNSYCYQRDGSNEYCAAYGMFIYRTDAGGNDDISIQMQRGSADIDGSFAIDADSGVFVMELHEQVDVFISEDGTGAQTVSGGITVDLNLMRTASYNDSASFTRVNNTTMDATIGMDALLMANCRIERPSAVSTNARQTLGARFEIAAVDQTRGQHGNYLRGNQSTEDTYNMSLNPAGIFTLTAGDDIQVESFDDGDNGDTDATVAGSCGFMAANLDYLAPRRVVLAD